ncbi:hypothetical protein [Natronospira bacteriovora]|uniref:Uncharacterized protein n=1 Tax=Natronospira bacteriovora TaxID=3069753 RepID=A0ABU0W9R9_9GAMM|nr:hypothetical protein [Natronospira sp. AB-CW4]MDQ2070658.1 hypothetical protein [Natronospira sp. AB-CW4]
MSSEVEIVGWQSSPYSKLPFRNPMNLPAMPSLKAFEADFGTRASAQATPCRFDKPPE